MRRAQTNCNTVGLKPTDHIQPASQCGTARRQVDSPAKAAHRCWRTRLQMRSKQMNFSGSPQASNQRTRPVIAQIKIAAITALKKREP